MSFTATSQFGPDSTAMQPTSSPIPEHLGGPEPMARTLPTSTGHADSPALVLVALVAAAIAILQWISR